jgi:mono/diheme cytochrome c family protein
MRKLLTALLGLLVILVVLAAASMGWALPPDTPEGNAAFKAQCASCHGPDGAGTSAGRSLNVLDLRSPTVQGQSDAQLEQIVKNGINNMPGFGDSLSDQEIAAVVAHVRTFGKTNTPASH